MITEAWRILRITGYEVILCLLCNKYSYNSNDILNVYCGYCNKYLKYVPEKYRKEQK